MKLQAWQLSTLISDAEYIERDISIAYQNRDYSLEDVVRMQLKLAETQTKILRHLLEVELEKIP